MSATYIAHRAKNTDPAALLIETDLPADKDGQRIAYVTDAHNLYEYLNTYLPKGTFDVLVARILSHVVEEYPDLVSGEYVFDSTLGAGRVTESSED